MRRLAGIPVTETGMRAAYIALFQAGWFVESMWSQTLVIHMIRTPKIPFIQSRASFPVFSLTFAGIALLTIILYMALATLLKKRYIRHYGELL